MKKHIFLGIAAGLTMCHAIAKSPWSDLAQEAAQQFRSASARAPETPMIQAAFSPNEGALDLVLSVIDSSKSSIHMLAYSFTSAPVAAALIRAKKRGVDVQLIVDYKNNLEEGRSGRRGSSRKEGVSESKAVAAMNAVANADIQIRTISVYPIHHDKSIISDMKHVQQGSFNYSQAAEKSNSENVLVLWNNPKLAAIYMTHFTRNWNQAVDYRPQY